MDEIGEETLFFALSYVIGQTYYTAKGSPLGVDLADSIAFAILDDLKRHNWRVFDAPLDQRGAGYDRPLRPRQPSALGLSKQSIPEPLPRRWRRKSTRNEVGRNEVGRKEVGPPR